ncbi:MAG: peptidoglycan editing factor PgeF [Candidatus Hydrogenedentes bacterium]|jgi:hypothetical protein|nr:peptidoglycan editing factor PgeF [Candidatus Hydrogenedentota bacterium]
MIRFSALESHGLTLAAMTQASDGDFSEPGEVVIPPEAATQFGAEVAIPAMVTQVHGVDIAIVDERGAVSRTEADGIATTRPAIPLAIRVADCVPLFLYEPERRVCAIVHAGREGSVHGIAREAVRVLTRDLQADASRIVAHIGPSAGPCCYQVSVEMAEAFRRKGLPASGRYIDLWGANVLQLTEAGLRPDAVSIEERCTICGTGFHSYRRDGTSRRNLAIVIM